MWRSIFSFFGSNASLTQRLCFHVPALTLVLAGSSLADPWYEHYAKAERAIRAQQWTDAVGQINEALARKGDSGARVRTYGMRVESYFPYLKLGIAYLHLGQLDAALQAFETEERLGAIAQSPEDLGELERFRTQALEIQSAAAAAEMQRIREIVDESLREASRSERQGQLDEAMMVLGQALAVAPDNADVQQLLDRLKQAVVRRQEARETELEVARLTDQARSLLAARRYGEASGVLRRALALESSDELQSLLDEAQRNLRTDMEAEPDVAELDTVIAAKLRRVDELEADGDLDAALAELQAVFAIDPSNARAVDVQLRLGRAQSAAERENLRRETIHSLLGEVEVLFREARFGQSLATSNRVLALDPGNSIAMQYVAKAYGSINQALLGSGGATRIPPAIRFADFREETDDGSRVQLVRSQNFRLSGVIIDNSPVEIALYDRDNREVESAHHSQPLGDYYITEFSLQRQLRPGLSTFRLVATDTEDLSSSSEYIVRYEQPFFRSRPFYALVAATFFGAGGLAYGRRARQREKLLRRRFNPYIAGAPILDQNLFFGRQQLIDRILQTIHNNSLLLYGERRIGKTSIQHQLKNRLEQLEDPDFDFYPVYIDLQGTPQESFFSTMAEDIFQELAPHVEGLSPSAELTDGTDYPYRTFVRDIRQVIRALKATSSKQVKLVLLIDEVDELNDYDPAINQKLRSLFMKGFADSLVAVVSGVEIKKRWEREGSPWYNFFEEIEVKPFRREDAVELIERPIRGIFKLEDGLIDRILQLSDGKPYLIQRLCMALVNRVHEQNRRTITVADVEAIARPGEA